MEKALEQKSRSSRMSQLNRRALIAGSLGAGLALPAFAQVPEGCGEQPKTAPALQPPLLLTDWAWLGRYRDDNAKLLASGAKVDVVFLGDSITEGWARTDTGVLLEGQRGARHQRADHAAAAGAHARGRDRAQAARGAHHGRHQRHRAQHRADDGARTRTTTSWRCARSRRRTRSAWCWVSVPPASKYWWRPEAQPEAGGAGAERLDARLREADRREVRRLRHRAVRCATAT